MAALVVVLVWLVPRFKAAFHARDARVWLPLSWALMVLVFFSISPGKRGVYILPALPALAIASLPFIERVLARAGVRRAGRRTPGRRVFHCGRGAGRRTYIRREIRR